MALQFLTPHEYEVVRALADRLLPPQGEFAGGGAAGTADYVDASSVPSTSTRRACGRVGRTRAGTGATRGSTNSCRCRAIEELAWRTRIEGSLGNPEREWNGPVRGWQEIYRDGIAALGDDLDLDAQPELRQLVFEHACEACYGAPEYGGNRHLTGWRAIGYAGDVQPRGWSDAEVTGA